MKQASLLVFTSLALSGFARGAVQIDQLNDITGTFDSDTFGASQIIPDSPSFSSMVLADVNLSGGIITDIEAGFGFSRAAALGLVTGWRISFFNTRLAGFQSGVNLTDGAVDTLDVSAADAVTSPLVGSGSGSTPTRVTLSHLNMHPGTGTKWMGVAAILNGGSNFDQAFVLANSTPVKLGGIPNNDVCVQPGDGFGFGGPVVMDSTAANAAYFAMVPEPASLIALMSGLLALSKRRRR